MSDTPAKSRDSAPITRRRLTEELPPTADEDPVAHRPMLLPTLRILYRGGEGIVQEPSHQMEESRLILGRDGCSPFQLAPDLHVSRRHARLRRSGGQLFVADGAGDRPSRHGTFVNGRRIAEAETPLSDGDILRVGHTFMCVTYWPADLDRKNLVPAIRGQSSAICRLRRQVVNAATNAGTNSILLLGESGTGKELVAHQLHGLSARAGAQLVIADLGRVPTGRESVLSELFGHVKGAFTGATEDRKGRFEEAQSGTIMLDELGELPLDLQTALLRALDTKRIQKLGATGRYIAVDVRVIAATNRDLDHEIETGRFRSDLYGRLQECIIRLPALRSRREDILMFVAEGLGPLAAWPMEPALVTALLLYPWPRNVREAISTGQTLARTAKEQGVEFLTGEMAPVWLKEFLPSSEAESPLHSSSSASAFPHPAAPVSEHPVPRSARTQVTKEELVFFLERTDGNVSEIARILGVNRKSIYRWMALHEITYDGFRSRS